MTKKHIVVGKDAPTEAKAKAMAEKKFGENNVVRGERIEHERGCSKFDDPIIGVDKCTCPRVVVFSNARALIRR